MKKIINSKKYDTEKAKKIGTYWYLEPGNINHISETLYRKRTGEFFLHCYGGANTKYAVCVMSNEWTGGETILPISYENAKTFASQKLPAEEYESIFGENDESEIIKSIRLSKSTSSKLDDIKARTGKNYGDIISDLLSLLEKNKK